MQVFGDRAVGGSHSAGSAVTSEATTAVLPNVAVQCHGGRRLSLVEKAYGLPVPWAPHIEGWTAVVPTPRYRLASTSASGIALHLPSTKPQSLGRWTWFAPPTTVGTVTNNALAE